MQFFTRRSLHSITLDTAKDPKITVVPYSSTSKSRSNQKCSSGSFPPLKASWPLQASDRMIETSGVNAITALLMLVCCKQLVFMGNHPLTASQFPPAAPVSPKPRLYSWLETYKWSLEPTQWLTRAPQSSVQCHGNSPVGHLSFAFSSKPWRWKEPLVVTSFDFNQPNCFWWQPPLSQSAHWFQVCVPLFLLGGYSISTLCVCVENKWLCCGDVEQLWVVSEECH